MARTASAVQPHQHLQDEKGQTVTWLARQVPCSRTNIYKIFDRPSIDTDMFARLSDIMGFDFFATLSDGLNRDK